MQKVSIPYGYNTFKVGKVLVYTGKIRVRTDLETIKDCLGDDIHEVTLMQGKGNCEIIQWTVVSPILHRQLISRMNRLLAHVMHSRIAAKYQETVYDSAPVELEW